MPDMGEGSLAMEFASCCCNATVGRRRWLSRVAALSALACVTLLIGGCDDAPAGDELAAEPDARAADVDAAVDAAVVDPPESTALPTGRRFWSASYGYFAAGGTPWVRNLDYTFTDTASDGGTVTAQVQQWGGATAPQRTVAGTTGPCNGTAGCSILQATPMLQDSWSGTYRYDGDTAAGTLTINWEGGSEESWSVDEIRDGTLGRMALTAATFPGSDPNTGRGYGSVQPFSYYKTAGAVDSVIGKYEGQYDVNVNGTVLLDRPWHFDMGGLAAEGPGAKSLHLTQSPTGTGNASACPGELQLIKGNIYHLWVNNADRHLVENNYFRCLVQSETGCYSGGMHIAMLTQVIDDHKNLVGVVGAEASTSGGFTYARIDAIAP